MAELYEISKVENKSIKKNMLRLIAESDYMEICQMNAR